MIKKEKLLFWIEKGKNVMFIGKHGVGKTSMILDAFKAAGLNYRYFSASTMDPFIDFCGVPMKIEEGGETKIRMILPETIDPENIEAIFLDEYNRCLTGDTKIQLADGKFSTIKDLVGKEKFYVYSYDVKNNKVAIGKGHSARLTEKNAKIYKIKLDNGSEVKCTGNHPFLLSDGTYVNAENLKENDSLMCLYKKYNKKGYELVSSTRQAKWVPTYHLSDNFNIENKIYELDENKVDRHHVDFNKYNNSPENIIRMSRLNHLNIHSQDFDSTSKGGKKAHENNSNLYERTIGSEESKIKALKNSIYTRKNSVEYKEKRSKISKDMYNDNMRKKRSEITKKQWEAGQFSNINRDETLRKTHINKTINILSKNNISPRELSEDLYIDFLKERKLQKTGKGKNPLSIQKIEEYFGSFDNFISHWETIEYEKENKVFNHRVISIEDCGYEDVYDISVDKYHNFALESGVFVHNSHKKIRNATMELIQFKSINGRKFPNLKIVWAAVNPADDEEQKYDVESADPAQEDRFQVHVEIPYKPHYPYFLSRFGEQKTKAAIGWWSDLPDNVKDKVSPRRLDYALEMYNEGGDIADIIPKEANPTLLKQILVKGRLEDNLREAMRNNDSKKGEMIVNDPIYGDSIYSFIFNKEFKDFYLPLILNEKISDALIANNELGKKITKEILRGNNVFDEVVNSILDSETTPQNIKRRIKKNFKNSDTSLSLPALKAIIKDNLIELIISTASRQKAYFAVKSIYEKNPEWSSFRKTEYQDFIHVIIALLSRSSKKTLTKFPELISTLEFFIEKAVELGYSFEKIDKANSKANNNLYYPYGLKSTKQNWNDNVKNFNEKNSPSLQEMFEEAEKRVSTKSNGKVLAKTN